jgi:hypothetical protein
MASGSSAQPALGADAALVLGMASTAMPFARSSEAEAERWLRVLRLYGNAGVALQALGVSEAPLEAPGPDADGERSDATRGDDRDKVAAVTEHAVRLASQRGANVLSTADVLLAVMRVYGPDFDHVLQAHGTDRDEVLARLGAEDSRPLTR